MSRKYLSPIGFGLLFTTPLFKLHLAHVHDSSGDLVYILHLYLGEAQDVEGILKINRFVKTGRMNISVVLALSLV